MPPTGFGAVELLAAELADGLVARGHELTVFASGTSRPPGVLVSAFPAPQDHRRGQTTIEAVHTAPCLAMAGELDVVLNHCGVIALALLHAAGVRAVTTLFGTAGAVNQPFYETFPASGYVAVSEFQRRELAELPWLGTVVPGVDVEGYPFRESKEEYLLSLGRIRHDRGTSDAIRAARAAGLPLVIAGPIDDERYFAHEIEPALTGEVSYAGEVGFLQKRRLLAGATALVHAALFPEPFALPPIEALACGTPVVGIAHGSLAELVADGETGILVADRGELGDGVARVRSIQPARCRELALERLNSPRMAEEYERVCELALSEADSTL